MKFWDWINFRVCRPTRRPASSSEYKQAAQEEEEEEEGKKYVTGHYFLALFPPRPSTALCMYIKRCIIIIN